MLTQVCAKVESICCVLPIAGPAADAQGQVKALEQLSAEVEANSSIALRSVWKWTCFQACISCMFRIPQQHCHSLFHPVHASWTCIA